MTEFATTDWGLTYRVGSADEWILRESSYKKLITAITPEDHVLDAGGYIGSFSARARQRGAKVIAFEPSPANFEVCKINAQRFGFVVSNAALVNGAVEHDQVAFYDAADGRRAPYSSLTPKRGYIKRMVPAIRMAEAQRAFHPTIVKLDVEGAEVDLLGALRLNEIRGLAVEWELARNRSKCVVLDQFLDDIGLKRYGKRLAECTGRAVVKIYLRS